MVNVTNALRANWALDALTGFKTSTRVDTAQDAIADLIADLLHLARGRGMDPRQLAHRAVSSMANDVNEDAEGEMAIVQARFRDLLPENEPDLPSFSR